MLNLRNLCLLIFAALSSEPMAQPLCQDTFRRTPTYRCQDPFYLPVCGCNGITYRNQCAAYWQGGVNNWTGGVCTGFDVDIFPNPFAGNEPVIINISFPDNVSGSLTLRIIDAWGGSVWQRYFSSVYRERIPLDPGFLKQGLYILVVADGRGNYRSFKLVRG